MVEPRYVKLSTTSKVASSMLMEGGVSILTQDVCFLDSDRQPKLLAGMGEPVNQLLQVILI